MATVIAPDRPRAKVTFLKAFRQLFNPNLRYIIFYGGRNSGKSHHIAEALLIRGRKAKLRILCTREIQNSIKDSVHKLLKDLIDKHGYLDYKVTNDSIVNTETGTEFIFKGLRHNTNEIKSTEGVDVAWVEEAQGITKASLDVLVSTIRKQGSQIIFSYNRYTELDPVHVQFVMNRRPNTYVKKVNYDILERYGLLSDTIAAEIEADKGSPADFSHKWLGEPIGQAENAIMARDRVIEAMRREVSDDGQRIVGVDVARKGADRTVFAMRKGLAYKGHQIHTKLRTTEICDALEKFIDFDTETALQIDDTGVGGGVTDEMLRRGYKVFAINFGGSPADKDKYPNWISEAWFHLDSLLDDISLPMNSELLTELSNRQWQQDRKGKRAVESKDQYKGRGFRSPDLADAFIICYGQPVVVQEFVRMSL